MTGMSAHSSWIGFGYVIQVRSRRGPGTSPGRLRVHQPFGGCLPADLNREEPSPRWGRAGWGPRAGISVPYAVSWLHATSVVLPATAPTPTLPPPGAAASTPNRGPLQRSSGTELAPRAQARRAADRR